MTQRPRIGTWVVYALVLAATCGAFLLVRAYGEGLVAGQPPPAEVAAASRRPDVLLPVLIALAVVIVVARAMGALFRRIAQPPVIGEVVAGIVLGPSVLGRIWPEAGAAILPAEVAPFLGVIAQVGVILFMFLVGVSLDTATLREKPQQAVAVSHASIAAPFLLGSVLALWLYPVLATRDVAFTPFALFMGVSLSVTAFPVLARILTDRNLHETKLGAVALACAAVDDVTAWCLLAFVVGVVHAEPGAVLITVALTGVYIAAMVLLARPAVLWFVKRHAETVGPGAMTVVFVALLASAIATEAIGIHALFGAFLLGALVPHDSALARAVRGKLEDVVVVLLLPAFFAFTGMRTQIGLVSTLGDWAICGVIIVVATAGKLGGSFVAARLTGMSARDAAGIGILMNTRGLMELIVLNIGYDLGVISPALFAMMVIMALVTTFATSPLLAWAKIGSR